MNERPQEQSKEKKYKFQTATIDGHVYNIDYLMEVAESLDYKEVPLDKLADFVAEGMVYWEDRNGASLSPFEVLQDWEAAQRNEAWQDHVNGIKNANLDSPILAAKSGYIFDGMHRLTKAFLENRESIKVRVFEELPQEALVD